MKHLIISILLITGVYQAVFAQQEPQFSHDMYNIMLINPAYAGTNGNINITALHRQQWVGFDGAPLSTVVSADAPINLLGLRQGVALSVMDDRLGFYNNFAARVAYAYHISLGTNNLSIGIDAGVYNSSLSPSWEIPESSNHTPVASDPSIPTQGNDMAFDLSAGIYFNTPRFYAGVSSTHLNQADINFQEAAAPQLKRHYYFTSGYRLQFASMPQWEFIPSTFVKFDGAASQINFNTNIVYNRKLWVGATYRLGDDFSAVVTMVGIEMTNGLKLGYAYDIFTSKTNTYNKGSHEIMLNYSINISRHKTQPKYKSVRFL